MDITRALDQYEKICQEVFKACKATVANHLRDSVVGILLLYMIIPRRINFTQMERYGQHDEQTYRNTFMKKVDWESVNMEIYKSYWPNYLHERLAIAIDPSYISKSGKCTPHIGRYWSGCAQQVKHGLEIMGIGIVNVDQKDCIAFTADLTPNKKELEEQALTIDKHYLKVVASHKDRLLSISKILVADAYFSKSPFCKGVTDLGFIFVSRFRDDANLHYIYNGPRLKKRGRPRTIDGKIDYKNLDTSRMEEFVLDGVEGKLYSLIAYSKALKRKVRLVIWVMANGKHKLYFSTDINMCGKDVLEIYRSRFQVEFVFRDCKQHAGLCHCQARKEEKLDFAFNASMTSVNVAKLMMKEIGMDYSMAKFKSLMFNSYLINRFIVLSGYRPNKTLIAKTFKDLIGMPLKRA